MVQIINPVIYGGGVDDVFPLVFSDGHIETIPMSTVHIEVNGISDFPDNGYPIIATSKSLWLTSGMGWKFANIKFGTSSSNAKCVLISNKRNDSQGNTTGRLNKGYLSVYVSSLKDLKNGKFIYFGDVARTSDNEIWYVWAEK